MLQDVDNVHIESNIIFGQSKTTSGKVCQLTIVIGNNSLPQKQSVSRFCRDAKRTFEFTEIQNQLRGSEPVCNIALKFDMPSKEIFLKKEPKIPVFLCTPQASGYLSLFGPVLRGQNLCLPALSRWPQAVSRRNYLSAATW